MKSIELREILRLLSLSQVALSHLIGVDPRTVRYWVSDHRPIPVPVAHLLHLIINGQPALRYLESLPRAEKVS
jgi:DNA-binding transcriptional regulator YiaG